MYTRIPRRPEIWSGVIQSTNQTDSRYLSWGEFFSAEVALLNFQQNIQQRILVIRNKTWELQVFVQRGGIPWNFIYCVSFFSIDQRLQSDLAGCPKPFWIMSRPRQCCSWSLPLPCCSSTSHRHGLPEARSSPAHAQDWMPLDEVDERMEKWINSLSPSCWYTKWNASPKSSGNIGGI